MLTYLATPYSHELAYIRQRRFENVNMVAAKLMAQGMHIFSPISHSHPIALAGDLPTDFDYWERYCLETLGSCGELLVLTADGWRDSVGVRKEIERMALWERRIRYVSFVDGEVVITDEPGD